MRRIPGTKKGTGGRTEYKTVQRRHIFKVNGGGVEGMRLIRKEK